MTKDKKKQALETPRAAAQAATLAERAARPAAWAARIIARKRPLVTVEFGEELSRRLGPDRSPGIWAAEFARRFIPREMGQEAQSMELAPFAPPQRQISSARQGAMEWGGAPPARAASASSDDSSLIDQLKAMGWNPK